MNRNLVGSTYAMEGSVLSFLKAEIKDLPRMLPTKFRFIWQSGFREEDFLKKSINQKPELLVAAMFVNRSELYKHSSYG
jgi:hypothetical protein